MADEDKLAMITAINAQSPNTHGELMGAALELLDECTEIMTIDNNSKATLNRLKAAAVLVHAFRKADEIEYR